MQPLFTAKFVKITTFLDPNQAPGQFANPQWPWPYVEGLTIEEAANELAFLVTGIYGHAMPNQHGPTIRLVAPWKYGFKSIKSIVRISLVEEQPVNSWQLIAPNEYGFYANVNPEVDHPRWSQASERRLPNSIFSPNRIPTEMFNGYGEQVAHLYKGMDLRKWY